MAIDPDVPSRNNSIYSEFLQWLVVNIPDEDIERGPYNNKRLSFFPSFIFKPLHSTSQLKHIRTFFFFMLLVHAQKKEQDATSCSRSFILIDFQSPPPQFYYFRESSAENGKKKIDTLPTLFFFAPRFFFALVFWPDNGAVVGTKRKHFLFFLPLPHILVTQATCWLNTLAHCRRTTAANIASSSWHTSSPMDQSSTRAACLTQSRATGHLGRVSAPANSPNSIGSASRWPSTISRQSSIRPCR